MSPITPEQQESLNQDFNKLNEQEKAELLLTSLIGQQFTASDFIPLSG